MSNTTYSTWTENPSRFRMPVADVCAHVPAFPTALAAGQRLVVKPIATRVAGGNSVGTLAWRPPS